ncbi:hypothetical protein [Lewinella sp. W8]|uniref:hypothetical protein n=1 Tax=Lewinella sp. W8 TaxID=2528208 RepID=UPI001067CFC0|nr:hypothetical protein [Lewinella sp. W8]MTB52705.1 hypothetical protein [Lewinella sp. W8]
MAKDKISKVLTLFKRYRLILLTGAALCAVFLLISLSIFYWVEEGHEKQVFYHKLADFLMELGQTIMGTLIIGGTLGGIYNFLHEEYQKEEDAVKERLSSIRESSNKRKLFRREVRNKLQQVHDDIELARILIRAHRSGRTYGEQLRTRIMPSMIALQDLKRDLIDVADEELITHLPELQVSITYMAAYLQVLIEEFSHHYLEISNLQTFQDVLANRRRQVFTDVLEKQEDKTRVFLEQTTELFENRTVPSRIETVWAAIGNLDYVCDFIADLRNDQGQASLYQLYCLDHHFHCMRMLRHRNSQVNEKIVNRANFKFYLKELERLTEKKNSDQPISKEDSLTRIIMTRGLKFDFGIMKMSKE